MTPVFIKQKRKFPHFPNDCWAVEETFNSHSLNGYHCLIFDTILHFDNGYKPILSHIYKGNHGVHFEHIAFTNSLKRYTIFVKIYEKQWNAGR